MAKRATVTSDLFRRTEGEQSTAQHSAAKHSEPEADYVRAVGVGLRLSEIAALDAEAERRGQSRGGLIKELIRRFLTGDIDLA